MPGRLTWMLRRMRTQLPEPELEPRKTYEFHVPPGVGVGTVTRVLTALRTQGLLQGDPEDWVIIPLVSSRHMYHQDNKDNG